MTKTMTTKMTSPTKGGLPPGACPEEAKKEERFFRYLPYHSCHSYHLITLSPYHGCVIF